MSRVTYPLDSRLRGNDGEAVLLVLSYSAACRLDRRIVRGQVNIDGGKRFSAEQVDDFDGNGV